MSKRMRLYQYAVILHPTPKDLESGARSEVIIQPSDFLMAASEEEVRMFASRVIPEKHMGAADRLEVVVWPFGSSSISGCTFSGCTITGSV